MKSNKIIMITVPINPSSSPATAKIKSVWGYAALVGFQSLVNIGVASGVLPNTGLPLPFVSYGLTSLLSLYIGVGLVLNVGLQPKKY